MAKGLDTSGLVNMAIVAGMVSVGVIAVKYFLAQQNGPPPEGGEMTMTAMNANSQVPTTGVLSKTSDVMRQRFVAPVNNTRGPVKPQNRFDLQTNYVMNSPDRDFDTYINDLILKEAKSLGFGAAANYPVRTDPWNIKTLIPTTQVEPSRDFNTVKMIS